MEIGINPNYSNNFSPSLKGQNNILMQQSKYKDCFELSSNVNGNKQVENNYSPSFSGLFSSLFAPKYVEKSAPKITVEDENAPEFTKKLAEDLSAYMDEPVRPSDLSCVLTPSQVKEILPTLSEADYDYSKSKDGSHYSIDLDYESNFSKGKKPVAQIMYEVADYADKYSKEHNGEKFTFTLSDRDNLNGVREALCMIAENPKKYRNLQFIPAVKLSFVHEAPTSQIGFENSSMIVYGINPFSQRISSLVDSLLANRSKMLLDFIGEVADKYRDFSYDIVEFAEQNDINYNRDFTVSTLYRRALDYLKSKIDDNVPNKENAFSFDDQIFEEVTAQADDYLSNLYNQFPESSLKISTSDDFENETDVIKRKINEIFKGYITHENADGVVVSPSENVYPQVINRLKTTSGDDPVIAIETPFYLIDYFGEKGEDGEYPLVRDFIKVLKDSSRGMLQAIGTTGPKYRLDKDYTENKTDRFQKGKRTTVEEFNKYIASELDLYTVGGSFDVALGMEENKKNS